MSKLPMIARYLLGAALVLFGANGFFEFIPPFEQDPDSIAARFLAILPETGYLWYLVKGTEVLVGILLVTGRYVPIALILLGPISVNIVAYHAFLDPANIVPALVVFSLNLYLLLTHRKTAYAALFNSPADAVSGE